jgi:hypothetical protein
MPERLFLIVNKKLLFTPVRVRDSSGKSTAQRGLEADSPTRRGTPKNQVATISMRTCR